MVVRLPASYSSPNRSTAAMSWGVRLLLAGSLMFMFGFVDEYLHKPLFIYVGLAGALMMSVGAILTLIGLYGSRRFK